MIDNNSHPLLQAAHGQGNIVSHVTTGNNTGSGFVVGPTNRNIVGPGGQNPGVQPSGLTPAPNRNIVGPGGQNPGFLTPSVVPTPNRNIVGPGGQNPLAIAANRVVNSMYGTGSFNSNQVHVNSIQNNIRDALSVANSFNNPNLKAQLLNAQSQLTNASRLTGTAQQQALQNARASMNSAHIELAKMGYNGGKSPAPVSIAPRNNNMLK